MYHLIPLLRHGDADIFDFIHGIQEGDPLMLLVAGGLVAFVGFAAIHQWLSGESFVRSKKERRRAYERRHHVIWKHERDE